MDRKNFMSADSFFFKDYERGRAFKRMPIPKIKHKIREDIHERFNRIREKVERREVEDEIIETLAPKQSFIQELDQELDAKFLDKEK